MSLLKFFDNYTELEFKSIDISYIGFKRSEYLLNLEFKRILPKDVYNKDAMRDDVYENVKIRDCFADLSMFGLISRAIQNKYSALHIKVRITENATSYSESKDKQKLTFIDFSTLSYVCYETDEFIDDIMLLKYGRIISEHYKKGDFKI